MRVIFNLFFVDKVDYERADDGMMPISLPKMTLLFQVDGVAPMIWDDPEQTFLVVINDEEQYSIWPDFKDIPKGWRSAGKSGPKEECLSYINEVWTDMRPLSLRQAMEHVVVDRQAV